MRPVTRTALLLLLSPPLLAQPIPPDQLQSMYRSELGPLYNPTDAAKLSQAHALLEEYFSAQTAADRKPIVQQIESLHLNPNAIGRLCRLRTHWPALAPGAHAIHEKVGPHDVQYFLGVPAAYDRTKPWPLVVKLPTPQPFLTQPPPTPDQIAQLYQGWIRDELSKHPDALLLMPLLNVTTLFGPSTPGMSAVVQPLLHAAGQANIDPARVYLIGHSSAADATWNLAVHYPTYFAAIAPLAGEMPRDWQRVRLMNLRNVFPVVWHDADDQAIKPQSSRDLVRFLRGLKIDVDYEETKGIGHDPTDAIRERVYAKLRSHTRDPYPQRITLQSSRYETPYNRIDWLQVYQPARPGPDRRVIFPRVSARALVFENPYRVEATRTGNRIDITADNVESLRLYLNDQMIDFTRPVTINVNRKGKAEGVVKPNLDEMLKDQLFLGRGWRYFPAVFDIEFSPPPATTPAATSRPTPATTPARGKIEIISPDGSTQTIRPGPR